MYALYEKKGDSQDLLHLPLAYRTDPQIGLNSSASHARRLILEVATVLHSRKIFASCRVSSEESSSNRHQLSTWIQILHPFGILLVL